MIAWASASEYRTRPCYAGIAEFYVVFARLGHHVKTVGAKRVVLDTLEVLFSGLQNQGIIRSELRRLFRCLEERHMSAVITAEQTYFQANNAYTSTLTDLNVDLTDVRHNWDDPTITITGSSPETAGFTVRLQGKTDGATKDLWVQCVYSRVAPPQWTEG